jgi:hypothetical protein
MEWAVQQLQQGRRWKELINLALLLFMACLLLVQGNAFAWVTAALFLGVFIDQSASFLSREQSKTVGWLSLGVALAAFGARLLYWYASHNQPRWVIVLLIFAVAFPLRARLLHWAGAKEGEHTGYRRQIAVHWALSALFFALFLYLRPSVPAFQAVLLLYSAQFFYQGSTLVDTAEESSETTRSCIALAVTVALLSVYSSTFEIHLNPLFHVLVAVIVANTIAIALAAMLRSEKPGIALGQDRLLINNPKRSGFLQTIRQSYQIMISHVQVWGVAAIVAFDLPTRMVRSSMQGNVFEASLTLVGLLTAVVFFLKERGNHPSSRYTMNGLWSLIAAFLLIAGAAFITLAISSGGATLNSLPNLDTVTLTDLFTQKEAGFGALILFLYEGLLYAVLMGLMLIGGVIRDVLRHEDDSDARKIALPGGIHSD